MKRSPHFLFRLFSYGLKCKYYLIFLFLALISIAINAQEKTITGNVSDVNTQETMPGVNIVIKGTTKGTITDIDGNFSVSASPTDTLVISYLGYLNEEVQVGSQTNIQISLSQDLKMLDEVVVVGYGTMKKSDVTGSIVSVKEEDITAIPTTNALEALQGKVAGLDITNNSGQTGSGLSLNLRGQRSLYASNDPLIIIDGVDYGTNLDVNPDDIASIEVLKDASSTAIYGSRGANGVIIITTKRGESGKPRISYKTYYGSVTAVDYPEFFLGDEYKEFAREAYRTTGQWESEEDDGLLKMNDLLNEETYLDWRDLLIQDGMSANHQFSVSGGAEKTNYMLSLNYVHEQGILEMDDLKRYGCRLSVDQELAKWAKTGINISYSYTDREIRNNPLNQANKMVPAGVPYNEDGTINIYPYNDGTTRSPLVDEMPGVWQDDEYTKRFFGSAYLQFTILKDINFKTSIAADIEDVFEGVWADEETIQMGGSRNFASNYDYAEDYLLMDNILSYSKDINAHSIQVMVGNSISQNIATYNYSEGCDFATNTFLYHNMYSAQSDLLLESDYEKSQLVSYFGRLHYKLLDRYIVQFTMRWDGASVLGPGHKWAEFPSASLAWRVNKEDFMQGLTFLSDLKLRASYGVSGNSSVDAYDTQGTYAKTVYTWGDDELASGYYPSTISNYALGWETTATTDIGLDLALFRNRIVLNADYYQQHTYDNIYEGKLPATSGYADLVENIGDTENKGIELSLATVNMHTASDFKWTSNITFAHNKEKIVKLNGETERDLVDDLFVGAPLDVYYCYEKVGIWQQEDSLLAASYGYRPGDIRIKDYNNDGQITPEDKVIVGQQRPKWTGGLQNTFSYKGVELSFFIYARVGQTIDFEGYHWDGYWYNGTASGVKVDYWTPDNPTNEFPRPDAKATYKTENEALQYVDGSFVKLRDITLAYNLPVKFIEKAHISSFRIYTTMKNYFMLYTSIDGYDTERGGGLSYPMTKQWLFGLNVEF